MLVLLLVLESDGAAVDEDVDGTAGGNELDGVAAKVGLGC